MQPAPRYSPLARIAIMIVGTAGILAVFQLMLLAGISLATLWTGRSFTSQLDTLPDLVQRYSLQLTILQYPAVLLWLYYCAVKLDGRSLASLGLRTSRFVQDLGKGLATGALAIGLLFGVLWLSGAIRIVGWDPNAFDRGFAASFAVLLGWMAMFFAVGFMEEVIFRGYLLQNATSWLGWRGGIVAQGVLFALIHMGNLIGKPTAQQAWLAFPSLVLIAAFFALSYGRTGSLWFPIGFHWGWNFFLGCVFSLPVSGIETFRVLDIEVNGPAWLTGGAFGAEASLLLPAILLVLIYFVAIMPQHPQAILDQKLLDAPPVPVEPEPQMEAEESRENRYNTRFGRTETFDADTLRQLKEMQEQQRLAVEAEARRNQELTESMRRATALARSESEAVEQVEEPAPVPETPLPVASLETPPETPPVPQPEPVTLPTPNPAPVAPAPPAPAPPVVAPPVPVPTPAPAPVVAAPAPSPTVPPTPQPQGTEAPKKKPSPRW